MCRVLTSYKTTRATFMNRILYRRVITYYVILNETLRVKDDYFKYPRFK